MKPDWKRFTAKRRKFLDALKNHPCMDCKGTFPPYVMDYDHRPGEQKLFNVGMKYTKSLSVILAEIAKCDLVCSNCHRVRTHNRFKS